MKLLFDRLLFISFLSHVDALLCECTSNEGAENIILQSIEEFLNGDFLKPRRAWLTHHIVARTRPTNKWTIPNLTVKICWGGHAHNAGRFIVRL